MYVWVLERHENFLRTSLKDYYNAMKSVLKRHLIKRFPFHDVDVDGVIKFGISTIVWQTSGCGFASVFRVEEFVAKVVEPVNVAVVCRDVVVFGRCDVNNDFELLSQLCD